MEWLKSFSGLLIGPSMVNPQLRPALRPHFPKAKRLQSHVSMGLDHTRTDFGPIRK